MNKQLKEDCPESINYIDRMTEFEWLGKTRNWWPQFIFHFTNIDNAIKVLESGKLLCRFKLEKNKQMVTDNASSDVLSNTDEKWKKIRSLTHYEIRLYVDGQLMCFDRFEDDEFALPF